MANTPPSPDLVLASRRLRLQPLGEQDVDRVHAMWTDPQVRRHLWDDVVISRDQASDVLSATATHFHERRYGLWGVYDATAGALAGFAGCRPWPTGAPELVYGLLPAWWGRGLATEACHAVLAHVFETLGHPLVFAATDPPNVASVRVMERLGMALDQRTEMQGLDTLVYRLSRERWRRVRALVDADRGRSEHPGRRP